VPNDADASPAEAPAKEMVWIPGGAFLMGSEDFYPEEAPVREAEVEGFWMDEHPVTVAEFRRFAKATGYATVAERTPDPSQLPGADPALLVPGSLVFNRTPGPVDLRDVSNWWSYVPGAYWRRPEGPGSKIGGRERHPAVHVAHEDAEAYAKWAGKSLPTEAEWERAARGGLEGRVYAWGDEEAPGDLPLANTWQGEFPWQSFKPKREQRTSPIGRYPPNGFGLYDITGNVWEWTADLFVDRAADGAEKPCCAPEPGSQLPRRVTKGGSHLCAPNYCLRYRPAARQGVSADTSTGHIGFRCIVRPDA
jgi:formylglycine-generating enzyme required for sulfatase activity